MAVGIELVDRPQSRSGIIKEKIAFLFDAAPTGDTLTYASSIPAGLLTHVEVKAGTTAFDSLTVTVTNVDGVPILSGTVTDTDTIWPDYGAVPFIGQLTVSLSGNTTADALGTVQILAWE